MDHKDKSYKKKKRRIFVKRLLHKIKLKRYSIAGGVSLIVIIAIMVVFLNSGESDSDVGDIITFREPWSIVDSAMSIMELDIYINPKKKLKASDDSAPVGEGDTLATTEKEYGSLETYLEDCIFLGDSRSVGLVNYGLVKDANVLAEVGIAHVNVLGKTFSQKSGKTYTLDSFLTSHDESNIYIGFGVNGMNYISEDDYEKSYIKLVDRIRELSDGRRIVLMSIWPVDDTGKYRATVSRELVSKYNEFLRNLADETGIEYLDFDELLQNEEGCMKKEFDSGDGLHYNKAAYGKIVEYIYDSR